MFSGTSKRKRYLKIKDSQDRIAGGEEDGTARIHAITGCDTTSQFVGIGKQKAWKAFDGPSVKLLERLGEENHPSANVLADAEAFVCQLYNHGTREVHINKERAAVF